MAIKEVKHLDYLGSELDKKVEANQSISFETIENLLDDSYVQRTSQEDDL